MYVGLVFACMRELAPDALVIGAGVIGSSIAYELARDGLSVCVVDRGAGPGQGSTSASSAVVRFNYSTWTGVASAWESKHLWQSWEDHLQGRDEGGLAQFVQAGGLCLDSPGQNGTAVMELFDRAGVPYEEWDPATIAARVPQLDPARHFPPKAVDSEGFWQEPTGGLSGCWTPDSGFIDDPQFAAHNLMTAAIRRGANFGFRAVVTAVRQAGGRVVGIETVDGQHIDAPVVVNVARPHSGAINELADVLEDFSVRTRPLRQEVHEVPAPPGYGGQWPGPRSPRPRPGHLLPGHACRQAPRRGRFLADIINACENGRDHDVNPVQVPLRYTGHSVDLAQYSRRRPINQDSSFSVMG